MDHANMRQSKGLSVRQHRLRASAAAAFSLVLLELLLLLIARPVASRESLLQGHRRLVDEEAEPQRFDDVKMLALYVNNIDHSDDISSLSNSLHDLVAEALELHIADEIRLQPLISRQPISDSESGSILPFTVLIDDKLVLNSLSSDYDNLKDKWLEALEDPNSVLHKADLHFGSKFLEFDFSIGEVDVADSLGDLLEEKDPPSSPSNVREELQNFILSQVHVMQVRLADVSFEDITEDFTRYTGLLESLRRVMSEVLGESQDRLVIFDAVDSNGKVVAQFTGFPLQPSDVSRVLDRWTTAVENQNAALRNIFPGMDFDFNPLYETGVPQSTTTSTPPLTSTDSSGASPGVIAGAVVGSLVLVGIVAGTGGYWYHKSSSKESVDLTAPRGPTDFADKSPVSPEGITPNALSNVNIHGETTPNPHNYKD